jgi:hypothetical protein
VNGCRKFPQNYGGIFKGRNSIDIDINTILGNKNSIISLKW